MNLIALKSVWNWQDMSVLNFPYLIRKWAATTRQHLPPISPDTSHILIAKQLCQLPDIAVKLSGLALPDIDNLYYSVLLPSNIGLLGFHPEEELSLSGSGRLHIQSLILFSGRCKGQLRCNK